MIDLYSPGVIFACRLCNLGSDHVLSAGLLRISVLSGRIRGKLINRVGFFIAHGWRSGAPGRRVDEPII